MNQNESFSCEIFCSHKHFLLDQECFVMTLCDILLSLGSAIYNAGCALIRYCYLKNSLRVELQVLIITFFVKLREREGQRVDPGRSLKGHLWMVDGGWWISFP